MDTEQINKIQELVDKANKSRKKYFQVHGEWLDNQDSANGKRLDRAELNYHIDCEHLHVLLNLFLNGGK